MKMKNAKTIALILAMLCILCFPIPASAISQGTDGTELQVMKPQNLLIHLGEDWAGVEFELTIDAGKYPGTIPVGEDGVLRLEIGGSENYILSFRNSVVEAPVLDMTINSADAIAPSGESDSLEATVDSGISPNDIMPEEMEQGSVVGIPVAHLVLYGGGLTIAIATLAGIHFYQKRGGRCYDSDDFDDDI